MTLLLVSFLMVLVAPLLIATWRTSLVGLGLQGLLMTAMVAQRGWPHSAAGVLLLVDLVVLRTVFVPRYLYGILRRQRAPRRSEVIPANLLSWVLAAGLVLLSFRFARALAPGDAEARMHLAVGTAGLLLGFLVLATQTTAFGQTVGVLRIENAIALFELAAGHGLPLPVQLGVTAALVLAVLTFGSFLRRPDAAVLAAGDTGEGLSP